MIIAIVILSIILIGVSYGAYNLIKQNEELEDTVLFYQTKFDEIREQALNAEVQLKELDIRGSFESDDEVGTVFQSIKTISNELSKNILDAYDKR